VQEALTKFPVTDRPAEWHLPLSNLKRQQINLREQHRRKSGECVQMTLEGVEVPMFVGTRLIACLTGRGFYNGCLMRFEGEGRAAEREAAA
jgi:hypothetical protein